MASRILFRCALASDGQQYPLPTVDITWQKQEQDLQQDARDAAERNGIELRFPMNLWRARLRISLRWRRRPMQLRSACRPGQAPTGEHEMTEQQELEAQLRHAWRTRPMLSHRGQQDPAQLLTLGQRELERVRAMGQELAVADARYRSFQGDQRSVRPSLRR